MQAGSDAARRKRARAQRHRLFISPQIAAAVTTNEVSASFHVLCAGRPSPPPLSCSSKKPVQLRIQPGTTRPSKTAAGGVRIPLSYVDHSPSAGRQHCGGINKVVERSACYGLPRPIHVPHRQSKGTSNSCWAVTETGGEGYFGARERFEGSVTRGALVSFARRLLSSVAVAFPTWGIWMVTPAVVDCITCSSSPAKRHT